MLRSWLFFIVYWILCLSFGLPLALLAIFLKPHQVRHGIVLFCRSVVWALEHIGGVKVEFKGLEKLPKPPFIIAAKHQSWGDGICMVAKFGDVAFVVGAFVEQYPFTKGILKKAGAMVVEFDKGHKRGKRISTAFNNHASDERIILIYPEGGMIPLDKRVIYKSGVYKFQNATKWPIVPIATNLGLYWPTDSVKKEQGIAINEVLEPIEAGLSRSELLQKIEQVLNDNSKRLFHEAIEKRPELSQANIIWPDEINHQTFYET